MIAAEILRLNEEEDDGLTLVEDGEWEQDCKYQLRTCIFLHPASGEHWAIHESRSGSYHTDWYYNDPDANRVYRKEETKVVVTWEAQP